MARGRSPRRIRAGRVPMVDLAWCVAGDVVPEIRDQPDVVREIGEGGCLFCRAAATGAVRIEPERRGTSVSDRDGGERPGAEVLPGVASAAGMATGAVAGRGEGVGTR